MWVVEMQTGENFWTAIVYCHSRTGAEKAVKYPHIADCGRPVRIREYGKPHTT